MDTPPELRVIPRTDCKQNQNYSKERTIKQKKIKKNKKYKNKKNKTKPKKE